MYEFRAYTCSVSIRLSIDTNYIGLTQLTGRLLTMIVAGHEQTKSA
jgi:hypothetical protein